MTLLEFLEARLAEDEAVARAATPGPWEGRRDGAVYAPDCRPDGYSGGIAVSRASYTGDVLDHPANAVHMARNHPARVLAEVEAKRQLIDELLWHTSKINEEYCGHRADDIAEGRCSTSVDEIDGLRMLAAPYASHPGYRAEWAVVPAS